MIARVDKKNWYEKEIFKQKNTAFFKEKSLCVKMMEINI